MPFIATMRFSLSYIKRALSTARSCRILAAVALNCIRPSFLPIEILGSVATLVIFVNTSYAIVCAPLQCQVSYKVYTVAITKCTNSNQSLLGINTCCILSLLWYTDYAWGAWCNGSTLPCQGRGASSILAASTR